MEIVARNDEGTPYLTIPCPSDQLGNFISGLLSKAQVTAQVHKSNFVVDQDELLNLYNLVDQRVTQQHKSALIQFSISVHNSDGSSHMLESIDSFLAYSEIKSVTPITVNLSWSYLILFPNSSVPAKQTIDFSFIANNTLNRSVKVPIIGTDLRDTGSGGRIYFRIEHTLRSWGLDIEALLNSYVGSIHRAEGGRIWRFLHQNSGWVGLFTGSFLFTLLVNIYLNWLAKQSIAADSKFRSSVAEFDTPVKTLRYVEEISKSLLHNGLLSQDIWYGFVLILIGIFSIFLGFCVGISFADLRPSYIVLTPQNKRIMEKQLLSSKVWLLSIGIGYLASISAGIIGNILTSRYFP